VGRLRRGDVARSIDRLVGRREDGRWAVQGEGCPWARAVPFSWQDLVVVNGGPQARRGFLDGFAAKISPAHVGAVARYRQVLERRNRLLQGAAGTADARGRIEPWDEQLVEVGRDLVERRQAAMGLIQAEVRRVWRQLGRSGTVELTYVDPGGVGSGPGAFRDALAAGLPRDVRRGQTLVGPHRDDVLIEVDGRDARLLGSRGLQRLLALALRLAEAGPVAEAVGSPPVLLLDDPLSELDPEARGLVMEHLAGTGGQAFLTTPEPVRIDVAATWWEVKGGTVDNVAGAVMRGAA
jgi:DNA replication and repair protein RecF